MNFGFIRVAVNPRVKPQFGFIKRTKNERPKGNTFGALVIYAAWRQFSY